MSGLTRFSFGTFCDGRRIAGSWAGCPVARDGPDVRADLADSGALLIADAGFPGQGPDVRDMSGCWGSWLFFLLLPSLPRTLGLGPWALHGLPGCT